MSTIELGNFEDEAKFRDLSESETLILQKKEKKKRYQKKR